MGKTISVLCLLLLAVTIKAQLPQLFQDEKSNKFGYKDETGKVIIKPVYNIAHEFEKDVFTCVNIGADYPANKGGKWGAIDKKGKIIIPVIYDNIKYLGYGLFAVNKGHIFQIWKSPLEGNMPFLMRPVKH